MVIFCLQNTHLYPSSSLPLPPCSSLASSWQRVLVASIWHCKTAGWDGLGTILEINIPLFSQYDWAFSKIQNCIKHIFRGPKCDHWCTQDTWSFYCLVYNCTTWFSVPVLKQEKKYRTSTLSAAITHFSRVGQIMILLEILHRKWVRKLLFVLWLLHTYSQSPVPLLIYFEIDKEFCKERQKCLSLVALVCLAFVTCKETECSKK